MRAIDISRTKAPKRKPRAKTERKLGLTHAPRLRKIKLALAAPARRPFQLPVAGEGSMF